MRTLAIIALTIITIMGLTMLAISFYFPDKKRVYLDKIGKAIGAILALIGIIGIIVV